MSASEQNNNMKRKCSTGACSIPPRTRPITTAARSIPSGSVPREVSPYTDFSIQVGSPPPSSGSPMSVSKSSLPQQFRQWQYRRRRTTSETSDDFKIDGAACTIASTPVQNEAAFPWMSNWSATTPPDDSRPCVTQQPQGIGDFDGLNRMRTGGVSDGIDDRKQKLPTVFKWEGGGKQVCISGSFNQWKTKITMAKSQGDFYTIIDLPEGLHEYKFYVDGQWICDNSEKKKTNDQGTENNVVNVKSSDFEVFEALDVDSVSTGHHEGMSGSPPGDYGQEIPHRTSGPSWHHGGPPILPPHLLQVILNKEIPLHCEPTLLPEPNHVMLNHLYALSIKDGVMVLSATHRYRKKYVTTLLYKPI